MPRTDAPIVIFESNDFRVVEKHYTYAVRNTYLGYSIEHATGKDAMDQILWTELKDLSDRGDDKGIDYDAVHYICAELASVKNKLQRLQAQEMKDAKNKQPGL